MTADVTSVFLVATNAALFPSIIFAWGHGYVAEALIMFTTFCVSVSYHLCQAHVFCIIPVGYLQVGDHYSAFSLIIWLMLFVSGMRLNVRVGVMFIFNYFIVLVMVGYMSSPVLQGALLIVAVLVTIGLFYANDKTHLRGKFYVYDALALLLMGSMGLFLYAWHSGTVNEEGYALRHSGWHLFSMFPLFLVISTRVASQQRHRGVVASLFWQSQKVEKM